MNNNRVEHCDFAADNSNTTQSKTLCEHFRKRKLMWITLSIVLVVLIITISMIILYTKKTNNGNISTTDKSTLEIATTDATLTTKMANPETITTTVTPLTATDAQLTTKITTPETIKTTTNELLTTTMAPLTTTNEPLTTKVTTPEKIKTTTEGQLLPPFVIDINTKWKELATTVAGGNKEGDGLNQLHFPYSIYIDDDDESIYISDGSNHRIVKWKFDAMKGEVVAGRNGKGNKIDQLNEPTDAIIDKENNSLIICDSKNRRIVRWSRDSDTNQQIMISEISCWGLTMDNNGDLYVSDTEKSDVKRWKQGETHGTIVAGGNGGGNSVNQFSSPRFLFVDQDYSVYVADFFNARVVKWMKGTNEGIVVARAQVSQSNPNYSHRISGVIVDHMGNIYLSETTNCKVTRWSPGSTEGNTVVGRRGCGSIDNSYLYIPEDLSFDRNGNLYVVDRANARVQKFAVDLD